MDSPIDIFEVYNGKTLFITGCTGFLGKVLLEKLLRSLCRQPTADSDGSAAEPSQQRGIKRIYLLIRPKKSKLTKSPSEDLSSGGPSSLSKAQQFQELFSSAQQRLQKDIVESRIFDRLKNEIGEASFQKLCTERLIAVPGDVMSDAADLQQSATGTNEHLFRQGSAHTMISPQFIQQLQEEVQVVIHSAASIAFQERLDNAVRLNTLGTLRVLEFAKSCKNIEAFCHVSTAYVNCNQKSGTLVEEKLYPLHFPSGEPVLEVCDRILQLTREQETERLSKRLLAHFGYPNTYTLTKSMAEHLVCQHRGNVPVAILRPTIIGASLKEPVPGWIDCLSASGSVFFMAGMGITTIFALKKGIIADQIPVDLVSNSIIAAVADTMQRGIRQKQQAPSKPAPAPILRSPTAPQPQSPFRVFHCGTGSKNGFTWDRTATVMIQYWQSHPPKKAVTNPRFFTTDSKALYNARFFAEYSLPTQVYKLLGVTLRSKHYQKTGKLLEKLELRSDQLTEGFRWFTHNEWIFDTSNLDTVEYRIAAHSDQQSRTFFMDTHEIDWKMYIQYFCYGIQKYVMKENVSMPTKSDITRVEAVDWFADITWAVGAEGRFASQASREQLMETVLQSRAVQKAVEQEAVAKSLTYAEVENRARSIMDRMFANPKIGTVRALAWMFRKIWRILYNSVVVDSAEIEHVRRLAKAQHSSGTTRALPSASSAFDPKHGPLVVIPTHRSYIDFLVMQYIFFAYGLPVPHIAAGEDFLNMFIVRDLFRHAGAFFLRRQFGDDELYKSIFSEYVQQLVQDGSPLEFFVEGTRSRVGKTLQPKFGLLSIICESFFAHRVPNLTVLPAHIAYEKLIEGEAYANELLGAKKAPETLANLLRSLNILRSKYGEIDVKFAPEISLKDYTDTRVRKYSTQERKFDPFTNLDDRRRVVRDLGNKIAYDLNRASVIMPSALVATVLLAYRQGLGVEHLIKKVEFLRQEVVARGAHMHWSDLKSEPNEMVEHALKLLDRLVNKNKFMIEPNIEGRQDYKNIVQLAVYRNSIIFLFAEDAFVCCALESLRREANGTRRISRERLIQEALFLSKLLRNEFIYRENPDEPEDFASVIDRLVAQGILRAADDGSGDILLPRESDIARTDAQDLYYLMCSLLWPFIESYWITLLSFVSSSPVTIMNRHTDLSTIGDEEASQDDEDSRSAESTMPPVKESVMLQKIQWLADRLFVESKADFYEACSMETIKNSVQALLDLKILAKTKRKVEHKKGQATMETFLVLQCSLKDAMNMYRRLTRFKRPSASTVVNPARGMISPFPIISKL